MEKDKLYLGTYPGIYPDERLRAYARGTIIDLVDWACLYTLRQAFGDVGFAGFWTLEMLCVQPIRIYAGVEICQIFYHSIEGDYETYQSDSRQGGKYQNNKGVQPSLLFKDFE